MHRREPCTLYQGVARAGVARERATGPPCTVATRAVAADAVVAATPCAALGPKLRRCSAVRPMREALPRDVEAGLGSQQGSAGAQALRKWAGGWVDGRMRRLAHMW